MTGVAAAWAALVVYVAGLALAFGVRSWQQWRATGSTGFRGVSGQPGSGAWWGGVLFVLALVLGFAAPLLVITGVANPFGHPVLGALGLVVAVAGLILTLAAQQSMGTSWRIGVDDTERTELVERGLFRLIRNPIFTGMITISAGLVIAVPTVVGLLSLGCLVVAVQLQVRLIEEPYLARVHGAPFDAYRASTGRFLPTIRVRGRAVAPRRPRSLRRR